MPNPRRSNKSRFDGARAACPRHAPPDRHVPRSLGILDDLRCIAAASFAGGVLIYLALEALGWLP